MKAATRFLALAALALVSITSTGALAQVSTDAERVEFLGKIGRETSPLSAPAMQNQTMRKERALAEKSRKARAIAALPIEDYLKDYIRKGHLFIGATPEMARLAWGNPEHVNRTSTSAGTSEQWVYGTRNYLYFRNGELEGAQTGH